MVKRRRTAEKVKEKIEEEKEKKQNALMAEDRCFICKDGGRKLYACGAEQCVKAYHLDCLKKRNLPLPSSNTRWTCCQHACSGCQDSSILSCYSCPTAVCYYCVDPMHFLPIKGQHGICYECRKLVLFVENEMVKVKELTMRDRLFKDYFEIVKKDECLDLKDLQSKEGKPCTKQKGNGKSVSDLNNSCGGKHERMNKSKRLKEHGKKKLNCGKKSQKKAVIDGECKVQFASIDSHNIRSIYLTRSLLQELLKKPELFESKVKDSYVRVKSAPGRYQLMQVTGVKKASNGDFNLQLLHTSTHEISIKSLSDSYFTEEECEVLRQKMKDGLLKKPTVDELEQKARSLHEDITNHWLAREKKAMQQKIDDADATDRQQLGTPSDRQNTPMGIAEQPTERKWMEQ